MSDSPDRLTGPKKEAIIRKSHLLCAFLDVGKISRADTRLHSELKRTTAEMGETLRYSSETADKALLSATPILSDIFKPSVPYDAQLGTINMVTAIGYEIGDMIEAAMFLQDIIDRLNLLDVLNTQPEKDGIIRKSLMRALATGAERKLHAIEAIPQEFRDFIHGLNNNGS
jgi:hypothetical protein